MLKKWEALPDFMKVDAVKPYYEILSKKKGSLMLKRAFDLMTALILLIIMALPMLMIACLVKLSSPGPVMYRQQRVTTYGKIFRIHKFRTMVENADQIGSVVTVEHDHRVTHIGKKLRRYRLDELPQLLDVIAGHMSFVGTRPEAVKYVEKYRPEYYATLLMPAGITSEASIRFKDEDSLLNAAEDVDEAYIHKVLPAKMAWNLKSIQEFRFTGELMTMFRTLLAVMGKNYREDTVYEESANCSINE